jgi:hypothetical protein
VSRQPAKKQRTIVAPGNRVQQSLGVIPELRQIGLMESFA